MKLHTAAACVAALFLASCVFGHTVAVRLLLLATAIVLTSVVIADKDVRALPPIWLPFALWGAWAALSLAWSLEPDRTWKEWRNEAFYAGAALWICFVAAQARAAGRVFPPVVGVAAASACAIALYEFSRGWERYSIGWHGGPGDHSSALLTLMPCAVMAGWYSVRTRAPRYATLCSLGLAAVFFASAYTTLNRTVWLGFAIQFVLLGALLLMRQRLSVQTKVLAPALAVAVIAGCGAVILSIQADRQALGVARPFQQDARMALWPEIVERIGERPLLGYGFGRGMLRDSLQQEFGTMDTHLWHAHNLFLEALLQLGVPGLLLLLLLLGAIAREGWRLARDSDYGAAACGIALLGVFAGMLARNMTDTLLVRQNALLFWGVVGLLLGLGTRWRASS